MSVPAAIYSKLSADGTLTGLLGGTFVYEGVAPATHNVNNPWLVFFQSAGRPRYMFDHGKFEESVWTVKAVERNTSSARVDAIAARVDDVLTDNGLTVTGGTATACWRESDVRYTEVTEDRQYRHSGYDFRIRFEPT